MGSLDRVVVVGASLAGLRAAETLRRLGYEGALTLVGAEPHLPYDRPPLSKEVLSGAWEPDRTALRKADSYAELDLDLRLGRAATGLDPGRRCIRLDDGSELAFDRLILATGARARRLPGQPALAGVHTLRTLDDCLALRAELDGSPRVVVVGAGFIGTEVAASCRARGLDVAVVERLPTPLGRVLGREAGALVAAAHRDHGVTLHLGVGIEGFRGANRVEEVVLAGGRRLPADVVVVGVGSEPQTGFLAGSGLELRDGVVCDEHCRTRIPGVFAAGDVARFPLPGARDLVRLEHWTHAVEQGVAAAENLLRGAGADPYRPVPFFWSDQYDLKIQLAGRPETGDEVRVVHGSLEERRCVLLYGRAGRLAAVLGFRRPRQVMRYRRMIREGASFDAAVAEAAG